MEEKKIVLLIDAENTSAKYSDGIMSYVSGKGDIISAQIYGDFIDNQNTKKWNGKAVEYNLQRYQADTTKAGKNAADIALVIDAMDFLYKENPADIFCIVTSDGDFTSLVERIRKEGITVIGMGKEDASPRLRRACSEYVELEKLLPEKRAEKDEAESKNKKNKSDKSNGKKKDNAGKSDEKDKAGKKTEGKKKSEEKKQTDDKKLTEDKKQDENGKKPKKNAKASDGAGSASDKESGISKVPLKNIKMTLNELVQLDENSGKQADLGGIKSRLQLKYPGFDERNYGYRSIRELIDQETKFTVVQGENQAYVISDRKESKANSILEQVCGFILDHYPKKVLGKHEVGSLGRKLKNEFPEFDYKEYGYSKLSLFLEEIGVELY